MIMHFTKDDLLGKHYSCNPQEGSTTLTGQPSRRLFDRFNGDQVLFIINSYATLVEKFTLAEARRMEELITDYLPLGIKSEMSVFNWLRETSLKPALA
jgi:hypothetical protein